MWNVRACRVCLSTDGRMDPPEKHRLHRAYETVAGMPLVVECGMPQWLCAECAHSLRKWSAFRIRCRRADAVLHAIFDTHMQITEEEIAKVDRRASMLLSPLVVCKMVPIVFEPSQCFQVAEVKGEESTAGHLKPEVVLVKKEEELEAEFSPPPPESDHHDSDSLKDEPLINSRNLKRSKSNEQKEVKTKTAKSKAKTEAKPKEKTETKPKPKAKPKAKTDKKALKKDRYNYSFYEEFTTITTLTREQQLEEIEKRRETDNYNHSPFKCTLCYKGFVDDSAFKNHMMRHDPASGAFECDICRRRFRRRYVLNKHITGYHSRRYACRSCQHVSTNTSKARLHENWHKGKIYQCSHCDNSFVKLTSYMSHLRIKHTSQFVCDICGNAFVSKKGVSYHKNLVHRQQEMSPEGPYCDECDVRFASEDAFKVHLVSSAKHNHNKQVTLTTQSRKRQRRRRCTNFTCEMCGDSFTHKYRLDLHKECKHTETREDGGSKSMYGSDCEIHFYTEEGHSTNVIGNECREDGLMPESKVMTAHCRSHDKRVPVDVEQGDTVECEQSIGALVSHVRTHTGEKPFPCAECPKRFANRYRLEAHARLHSGERPYACPHCARRYRMRASLGAHVRLRHPTEFVCDVCGDSFVGKHGLAVHKKRTHKEARDDGESKSVYCSECDVHFSTEEAWKRHTVTSAKHSTNNDFGNGCRVCGEMLESKAELTAHGWSHVKRVRADAERDGTVVCEQCDATFSSARKCLAHFKRMHLGMKNPIKKNVVCEVCGKKCTSNSTLAYHQRTHTGEKPFQCSECPKRFSIRQRLQIHERTHTGERPYPCHLCHKAFPHKPALNRHSRVHTGAKPYECNYCGKTFSQSNSMKLHVHTVHLKLPPPYRSKAAHKPPAAPLAPLQ